MAIESFFCDLIKGFSVSKFQSSFPSLKEKALITLSKSTPTTLFFVTFIFELNPDWLSLDQFISPVESLIE